jgi:hypothetical protein
MNAIRSIWLLFALITWNPTSLVAQEISGGQSSPDFVNHHQVIPSGWSAINNGLETEDSRISSLIPSPPEGFLFFKWLGDWDVNQFQFGSWNFDDQILGPGESGLILNPGEAFEISWEGLDTLSPGFTGFFSGATSISASSLEVVAVGSLVYEYLRATEPGSNLFDEQWLEATIYTFLGFWIPEAVEVRPGDVSQLFFVEHTNIFPSSDAAGRQVGADVYVNNYVPALGINAPIGHGGCDFEGGDDRSLFHFGVDSGTFTRFPIEVDFGGMTASFPVFREGFAAGYFGVNQGATFTLRHSDVVTLSSFSSAQDGLRIQGSKWSSIPRPPTVLTGLQPELLRAPNLGPDCGISLSINQTPEGWSLETGDSVVIPVGLCEFEGPAATLNWETKKQHVDVVLEKRDEHGSWVHVAESQNYRTFVLEELTSQDSGTYRYYVDNGTASGDCIFTGETGRIISNEFEIEVVPSLANRAPVANAGENIVIVDSDSDGWGFVHLDGSASIDVDGQIAHWLWRWDGEEMTGSSLKARYPVGENLVQLVVRDNQGAEHVDEVLVEVLSFSSLTDAPLSLIGFRDRVGEVLKVELTGLIQGTVWGTDRYADHSTLGKAAVHAGVLSEGEEGAVFVLIESEERPYSGSHRNGVQSDDLASWGGGFQFLPAETVEEPAPAIVSVTRILPSQDVRINETFTVTLEVVPSGEGGMYRLVESLLNVEGIEFFNASHEAIIDEGLGMIEWGPFSGSDRQVIQFQARIVDADYRGGLILFSGQVLSEARAQPIEGDLLMSVSDAPPVQSPRLERKMAETAQVGDLITIELSVEPGSDQTLGVVTEQLPSQVSLVEVEGGGIYDPLTHTLTWNLLGKSPVRVFYEVLVESVGDSLEALFRGSADYGNSSGGSTETVAAASQLAIILPSNEAIVQLAVGPVRAFISDFGETRLVDAGFLAQLFVQQTDGSFQAVGSVVEGLPGFFLFSPVAVDLGKLGKPIKGKIRAWSALFGRDSDLLWRDDVIDSEAREFVGDGGLMIASFDPLELALPICANGGTFLINSSREGFEEMSVLFGWIDENDLTGITMAVVGDDAVLRTPVGDGCGWGGIFEWSRNGAMIGRDGVSRPTDPSIGDAITTAEWTLPAVGIDDAGAYGVKLLGYGDSDVAQLVVLQREPLRHLPEQVNFGEPLPVTLTIPPFRGASEITVVETIPANAIVTVDSGGVVDELARTITWTVASADRDQEIGYELSFAGPARDVAFDGVVQAIDVNGVGIGGDLIVRKHNQGGEPTASLFGVRDVPSEFEVGKPFKVLIEVLPRPNSASIFIEETIPQGAELAFVPPGHLFSRSGSLLNWGPYLDGEPRILSYDLIVEDESVTQLSFSGTVSLDDDQRAIDGDPISLREVDVVPPSEMPEGCSGEGGLIIFLNSVGPVIDLDGNPAGEDVLGQLYVGDTESTLQAICEPVNVLALGVFIGGELAVPNTVGGENVMVQVRAWKGAGSYETAEIRGESEILSIRLKTPGDLVPAPAPKTSSFTLEEVVREARIAPPVREGNGFILRWTGPGRLQESSSILGPFSDSLDQSNPQQIEITDSDRLFFRILQE